MSCIIKKSGRYPWGTPEQKERDLMLEEFDRLKSLLVFKSTDEATDFLSRLLKNAEDRGFIHFMDVYDTLGAFPTMCHDGVAKLYGWPKSDIVNAEIREKIDINDYAICSVVLPPDPMKNLRLREDKVDHPSHYQTESGLETIQVIESFTGDLVGVEAFDTGNILKYMCRWNKKNGLEDLNKAKWYLDHLINYIENNKKED